MTHRRAGEECTYEYEVFTWYVKGKYTTNKRRREICILVVGEGEKCAVRFRTSKRERKKKERRELLFKLRQNFTPLAFCTERKLFQKYVLGTEYRRRRVVSASAEG